MSLLLVLLLEVIAAMSEKSPNFSVDSILFFKELITSHQESNKEPKQIQYFSDAVALERKRFDLDLESISMDLETVRVFKAKLEDREAHLYHCKLSWKQQRHQKVKNTKQSLGHWL